MNKQLLDAYDQINLTISDLEVYLARIDLLLISEQEAQFVLENMDNAKESVKLLMELEGMKIPRE